MMLRSWQRLKMVLSCLPGVQLTPTQQPPPPLPVVLLTLASEAATDAISGHLAAVAADWQPAVAARLLQQGEPLGKRTNVAALAGNVRVASLVETPVKVLRQALSYMAEFAPMYEQVGQNLTWNSHSIYRRRSSSTHRNFRNVSEACEADEAARSTPLTLCAWT